MQRKAGTRILAAAQEGKDWVHPYWMICGYQRHRYRLPVPEGARDNTLMIPYYLYAGGDAGALARQCAALRLRRKREVVCHGARVRLGAHSLAHVPQMTAQIEAIERWLHGQVRGVVREYTQELKDLAQALAQEESGCYGKAG
jgi:hypothetical protein